MGALRSSTKYLYPSDNSLIRAEKHYVANKRLGCSLVLKDNLAFGIRERVEAFRAKSAADEDEIIRNREIWDTMDLRCELWVEFENGTKLLVEMADKTAPNMKEIPLQEPNPEGTFQEAVQEIGEGGGEEAKAGDMSPASMAAQQRVASAQSRHRGPLADNYEPLKGARLSFAFSDVQGGLVLQVLPNGDVL